MGVFALIVFAALAVVTSAKTHTSMYTKKYCGVRCRKEFYDPRTFGEDQRDLDPCEVRPTFLSIVQLLLAW